MAYGKSVVSYDGSNLGTIYLRDIGMRSGLGGGRGIYVRGQDQYINYGADATLISTSDVMLSATSGVIKKFSDLGALTITIVPDA